MQAIELYQSPRMALPFPLTVLDDWQPGTVGIVAGGPGSGKSSLAALLDDLDRWITSEQSPNNAALLLARCRKGQDVPPVDPCPTCDAIRSSIESLPPGSLVVVDSITAAGSWDDQAALLYSIAEWTRATSSRVLVIQQVNATGEGAGLTELPHLVDWAALIERDEVRRFSAWKNRGGNIGSAIFSLGSHGVERPRLDGASYSVEGVPGRYKLHPWPLPGGKWGGLFDAAWRVTPKRRTPPEAIPGLVTAALPVRGYPGGVLLPLDVEERRRFGEVHGLTWVGTLDELAALSTD